MKTINVEKIMSEIDQVNGLQVSTEVSTTIAAPEVDPVTEKHQCDIKVSTDTKSVTYTISVDGESYEFRIKKSWLKKVFKAIVAVADLIGDWKKGISFKKIR
jgi:hypothetical protein